MTPDHLDAHKLAAFIDAAPSPYHAAALAAQHLRNAGFEDWGTDTSRPLPRRGVQVTGGALLAWTVPDEWSPRTTFRILGAHTDSPNLRIKPQPTQQNAGFGQLGVEVYGGVLLNSWLDRDLGISGRVVVRDGDQLDSRLVQIDTPQLRIPQLAIHLDRDINTQGLKLNPQRHLTPLWSDFRSPVGSFRDYLSAHLDAAAVGFDVMTHDLTPSCLLGRDQAFLSAPRIDNLASCWAGTEALIEAAPNANEVAVLSLYDHEEVGSTSRTGADSVMLARQLERIHNSLGGTRQTFLTALEQGLCLSVDGAHGTHPNYPEMHDPHHRIELNGGPALKTNASMRYATEATTASWFREVCREAKIPLQEFVSRSDLLCGSTIGPTTSARLGMATLDIGLPQLSMHSARELCGSADPGTLRAALVAALTTPLTLPPS